MDARRRSRVFSPGNALPFRGYWRVVGGFKNLIDQRKGTNMKQRGKTSRLRAALKKKSVKKNLRKSRGERKYR
jgi:hypothetical protein